MSWLITGLWGVAFVSVVVTIMLSFFERRVVWRLAIPVSVLAIAALAVLALALGGGGWDGGPHD